VARHDYYEILGIRRDATPDEIKKAFRGLALKNHPDRNPDDPDAELRFREIAAAYQVLSDPEQRYRYDRLGPFFRPDGRPPTPEDISEMLGAAVAGLFKRKKGSGKGADLRYTLSVPLEKVATGADIDINLVRQTACGRCNGGGGEPDGGTTKCETCAGSGRSPTRRVFRSDCPRCDGTGKVIVKRCTRCKGVGVLDQPETLRVRVPPGVATGQKLKLRSKGNNPRGGGKPGDLYVLIAVDEHSLFRRRGADLFAEVPLTFAEAALGTELVVPTLAGTTAIRIPPGTANGKVFRLPGRGIANSSKKKAGDLHIKVEVEVPPKLTEEQRIAVRRLGASLGPSAHPRRHAYDDALASRNAQPRQNATANRDAKPSKDI
jgi:molecular chaperone DnaJ